MYTQLKGRWIQEYGVHFLLILFLIVVMIWFIIPWGDKTKEPTFISSDSDLLTVKTVSFKPELTRVFLNLVGFSDSFREVVLKSELQGIVNQIHLKKGIYVKKDKALIVLEQIDQKSQLNYAKAFLKEKQLKWSAIEKLAKKDLVSSAELASARADLDQAKASLEQAENELSKTIVSMPFQGWIDDINVEVGEFVSVADDLASVYEINPYVVRVRLSENQFFKIKEGQAAYVTLMDGTQLTGKIGYLSHVAEDSMRSYKAEIYIDNPEQIIYPINMTVQVSILTGERYLYEIPPYSIGVDEFGYTGIYVLGEENMLEFLGIEIVESLENTTMVVLKSNKNAGSPKGETLSIVTSKVSGLKAGDSVKLSDAQNQEIDTIES